MPWSSSLARGVLAPKSSADRRASPAPDDSASTEIRALLIGKVIDALCPYCWTGHHTYPQADTSRKSIPSPRPFPFRLPLKCTQNAAPGDLFLTRPTNPPPEGDGMTCPGCQQENPPRALWLEQA